VDDKYTFKLKNNLFTSELAHIDLCIKIINKVANKLSEQIIQLPNMDAFI
jgi:serine/threonine-protein kinase HipA